MPLITLVAVELLGKRRRKNVRCWKARLLRYVATPWMAPRQAPSIDEAEINGNLGEEQA